MSEPRISRVWAMPNSNTFSIKPIQELISRYIMSNGTSPFLWVDPFSRNSPFKNLCVTNDLNPEMRADYSLEALDFFNLFRDNCADGVLFDPPYSPRQIMECYNSLGRKVHTEDTQSGFYSQRKAEVARILKPGGVCISFGWNSSGIGKKYGFEIEEILLVSHGSAHNDTICTVDRKPAQ